MEKIIADILAKAFSVENLKELTVRKILKKLFWYIVLAAVLLAVYVCFQEFALSDSGKKVLGAMVREFPFLDATNTILKGTFGYAQEITEITDQFAAETVLTSLCKVLFMVLLTSIFKRSEDKKLSLGTWKGTAMFLLECLKLVARIVLTAILFDSVKDALDAFDPTMAMVLALTFFVMLFLLVGFGRALLDGTPVESAMSRTYLINIIPELIEVFISNTLCLVLYIFWVQHPYSWQPAVTYIGLLVWFVVIQELLKKLFEKLAEGIAKKRWRSSSAVSAGQFILWILCSFFTMTLLYSIVFMGLKDTSYSRLFSLPAFPFVSAVERNLPITDLLLSYDSGFWSSFFALTSICIVVTLLVKRPLFGGFGGMAFYVCIWVGVTHAAGLLAHTAILWLLSNDNALGTNRYNGVFGIVFFLLLIFLLLYNYQIIVAAAITAILILCAFQGLISSGITFRSPTEGGDTGQFWAAYAAAIAIAAIAGAFFYGARKK